MPFARVHRLYLAVRFRIPNLSEPRRFSDLIPLLICTDFSELRTRVSDKIAVRTFIQERGLEHILPEITVLDQPAEVLAQHGKNKPYVLKASNDSGSVLVVNDRTPMMSVENWVERYQLLSAKSFGLKTGEWNYWTLERRCFVEEFLGTADGSLPTDYKFHCVMGEVIFVQVIWDRHHKRPKEACLDWNDGNPQQSMVQLDQDFTIEKLNFQSDRVVEMGFIATRLSQEFRYVRVDLYDIPGRGIVFGEMTNFPRAGNYKGRGDSYWGAKIVENLKTDGFLAP